MTQSDVSHNHHLVSESTPLTTKKPSRLIIMLSGVQFMLSTGVTIAMVAVPTMREDLGMSATTGQWIVTAYILAFGGFLLIGGRLVGIFGSKPILLVGIAIFSISSLAGGISSDGIALIGFRAAQGLGAALASPAGLSLLLSSFAEERLRRTSLAAWAAAGAIGATLGNVIGGILTTWASWPSIFFANAIVALLLFITISSAVPVRARTRSRQGGFAGAIIATVALAVFLFALTELSKYFPSVPPTAYVSFIVSSLLALCFIFVERRSRYPLLPARIFRGSSRWGIIFVALGGTGMGIFYVTTIYMQDGLLLTPLEAGLYFIAWSIASAIGSQCAPTLIFRWGIRTVMMLAFSTMTLGIIALSLLLGPNMGVAAFAVPFAVLGIGQGLMMVSATTVALVKQKAEDHGLTSSVVTTSQQVGGAIFVCVSGVVSVVVAVAYQPGVSAARAVEAGVFGALLFCGFVCLIAVPLAFFGLKK